MHRFVREKGPDEVVAKPIKRTIAIESGRNARETYESILQMPSTSAPTRNEAATTGRRRKKPPTRRKVAIPYEKNSLFRAAMSNDVETIEQMSLNNRNVNVTDQFGWTALMMAACAGHLDVIKVLIRCGAKVDIESHKKDTAFGLAEKGKHQLVVEFLKPILTPSEPICLSSDDEDDDQTRTETFFCDTCQAEFSNTDRKSHAASTLHRFNRTDSRNTSRHFGIPESNVGFQMLLQQGWDRESGLGAERDGIMYPIKTTLRKPRSGLGTRQPARPKVTHFKAFDCDAVKTHKPASMASVTTKRQMRTEQSRAKRKDRYLRKLLS